MGEKVNLESMVQGLKDFRSEVPYQTSEGETVNLVTEILDLKHKEDLVEGIFSEDFVRRRYYRREGTETLVTEEAPFWIKPFKGKTFIIVSAPSTARGVKSLLTTHVANKLSEVLFKPWEIPGKAIQ